MGWSDLIKSGGRSIKYISNIRYQLLHRIASAHIEAQRFCAPHELMLVHSFSQDHKWFEDYAAFAGLYWIEAELNTIHFAGEVNGKNLYMGWIVGEKEYLLK